MVRYADLGNSELNWDRVAFGEQMGFTYVDYPDDIGKADVVIGSSAFTSTSGNNFGTVSKGYQQVVDAIKTGKPYIAIGAPLGMIKTHFLPTLETDVLRVESARGYDALFHVDFSGDSLITASHEYYNNDLMYGFGGANIKSVPVGSNVLITAVDEDPLMGYFPAGRLDLFKGSVQAFEYKAPGANGLDITVFANSLTRKTHQQADYVFAANAVYSKVLGEVYTGAVAVAPGSVKAIKTSNVLVVNGEEQSFPAVLIQDSNWLRLRDVAMLLSSTTSQFSIRYDGATNTVSVFIKDEYVPLGGELEDVLPDELTAQVSPQKLMVDGMNVDIVAYNIEGYNFFRLRDLAAIIDFNIDYNPADGVITVATP
jgi:hypothetical protein